MITDPAVPPDLAARVDDWFLLPVDRGNPATEIDRRRGDGRAWTDGNDVTVLVDGAEYFRRLYRELCRMEPGDWVHLTDWEGDPDQQLDGPGTEIGKVLADLARRDVHVRGLLWRSHPRLAHFSEQENTKLVREVNDAGGELLLDERVRRGGSHHQKLVVLRRGRPEDDVAFVGGIDLCHSRGDSQTHHGDRQAVDLNPQYGNCPPWHDLQLEIRGPAVGDLAHSFRERWTDPTPFDHRNPVRIALRHLTRQPRRPDPLPPARPDPPPAGTACGTGAAHLPGEAAALPVRAERRAQHRARVPQGAAASASPHLLRGPVPVVGGRGRHSG